MIQKRYLLDHHKNYHVPSEKDADFGLLEKTESVEYSCGPPKSSRHFSHRSLLEFFLVFPRTSCRLLPGTNKTGLLLSSPLRLL